MVDYDRIREITDFKEWWRQANYQSRKVIDLNEFHRKLTREDVRSVLGDLRFEMSGYDIPPAENTVFHNQTVLSKFTKCGIYDYTDILYLDFYKGSGDLHYRYARENIIREKNFCGESTSEIITQILELTVYSGRRKR